MLLLYCANGIVVAMHDDADVAVPASAYPGARIIPYDQPLSTLPRIGNPPPPLDPSSVALPIPDLRPYAQPTETPYILTMFAAQVRYNTIAAGFTFNAASGPIPVDTMRESWMLVNNLAHYAASVAPTTVIDFTQVNVHYPITAQEAISLFNQFGALQQQCRTIEANIIADQQLATPTLLTYADVEAQFAGVKTRAPRQ